MGPSTDKRPNIGNGGDGAGLYEHGGLTADETDAWSDGVDGNEFWSS